MEPQRGFFATLWNFLCFLPFFLGLLVLAIIKGALLCPVVCLILTIGNSAIILGLWPVHAFWTYYSIARTKQFGPCLKLVICIALPVLLVLWPLLGILGSVVAGVGYGFFAPLLSTFEAVGEGKTDEFIHCFVDGTWSTIKGCFTVVRDLKDLCFHSYFSIMDDLHLHKPSNGEPYEIRLFWLPAALLVGVLGIMIDMLMITLVALFKSPYMLFKGWNRLFHDLVGREGPFLETACVPFAGLAILLWPAAVVGAVAASVLSSCFLGGYAAIVTYQESSFKMGMTYIISSLAIYDEYSNDILDMQEGSCFPRRPYRKKEMLPYGSFSRHSSFQQENQDAKNPPSCSVSKKPLSRSGSIMNVSELKPFKLLEELFAECRRCGEDLIAKGVITDTDIEESRKSGKNTSAIINIGLPAYCILQALLRSAKANTDGLLLSNNTEITSQNRPKDKLFDYFLDPLLIMKEQIRVENLSEDEEGYLSKLVLFFSDSDRLKTIHAGSPLKNERREAEINAIARRLQGITRSTSRFPTVKRRLDELVKYFSDDLERRKGGSQSGNGSQSAQRMRSGIARMLSQKSFGSRKPSTQDDDQQKASLADNVSVVQIYDH
ncbi:putative membrane protein-like [Iris pallida]|uniref:Membrane protein-like n=1 Tax=Iris pallida TaxID=29817 RepID=A0AAX6HP66_IRIPA|nr:putative membrane protein-like [Iris pallida]